MAAAATVEQVGATVGKGLRVDSEKNVYGKSLLPEKYSNASHGLIGTYVASGVITQMDAGSGTLNSGATICCNGTDLRMTGAGNDATLTVVLTSASSGSFQIDHGVLDFTGLGAIAQYLQNKDPQVGDWIRLRGEAAGYFVEECRGKWSVSAVSL